MGQEIIVAAIIVACGVGLVIHYRKSVRSRSCSCCSTGKPVCHCKDKR